MKKQQETRGRLARLLDRIVITGFWNVKTRTKTKCYLCGFEHSRSGQAVVSHMRKHVREGVVIEIMRPGDRGQETSRKWVSADWTDDGSGYRASYWQTDYSNRKLEAARKAKAAKEL